MYTAVLLSAVAVCAVLDSAQAQGWSALFTYHAVSLAVSCSSSNETTTLI